MIREFLKKKDNPAIRAKTKLLLSSYFSDDGSQDHNDSKIKEEDDLKFSQTKMDEIIELENEDQENDNYNNFMGDHSMNQSQNQIREDYAMEGTPQMNELEVYTNEEHSQDMSLGHMEESRCREHVASNQQLKTAHRYGEEQNQVQNFTNQEIYNQGEHQEVQQPIEVRFWNKVK